MSAIITEILRSVFADGDPHGGRVGLLRLTAERLVLVHHGRALVDLIAAELV